MKDRLRLQVASCKVVIYSRSMQQISFGATHSGLRFLQSGAQWRSLPPESRKGAAFCFIRSRCALTLCNGSPPIPHSKGHA